jgi:hypothetical protein
MNLAVTVSIVVICVLVVVAAIGFVIDKHAGRLDGDKGAMPNTQGSRVKTDV